MMELWNCGIVELWKQTMGKKKRAVGCPTARFWLSFYHVGDYSITAW